MPVELFMIASLLITNALTLIVLAFVCKSHEILSGDLSAATFILNRKK